MIEYLPKSLTPSNLFLIHYGIEACTPGHSFGPAMRDYYKVHYILEGEGFFESGGQSYRLKKGQGFLICPDNVTYYKADDERPWHYCWVAFDGIKAASLLKTAGLSIKNPFFTNEQVDVFRDCIDRMIDSKTMLQGRELRLTGLLYIWLSALLECAQDMNKNEKRDNHVETYVTQVVDFIEMNYANPITVTSIAELVGLQRSYLSSLFKANLHTSIQEYLIDFRMRKACELIRHEHLTIGDIARSVGYSDPLIFSKMFRKRLGKSPTDYRKSHDKDIDNRFKINIAE